MAYQTIPPAPAIDWRPLIHARIKQLDSTLVRLAVSSNGTNISGDMTLGSVVGTGTVTNTTTIEGGATRLSSGATAGGTRVANLGANATPASYVSNTRTIHWAVYQRCKAVTSVVSGAEVLNMCCVLDTTNDNALGQAAVTSTTNWTLTVGGVGADTGVAFDTSWHEMVLWNDGTTLRAYLDWTQIASAASTGLATTAGNPRSFAFNAAVNGTVNYDLNRWAFFTPDAT
jgi:hypothetical protein